MNSKVESFLKSIGLVKTAVPGEIGLKLRAEKGKKVRFWVNGDSMEVNWGDGSRSGIKRCSEYFEHTYTLSQLYEVHISGKGIVDLDIKRCGLTELEVNGCPSLEFLDCSENDLTELDVRNCRHLYELYCGHNRIRDLKLKKYHKLCFLSCPCNELEEIKLDGCRKLYNLICKSNRLERLDVSKCRQLATVNVEKNWMDSEALNQFLSTLTVHPLNNKGLVILRHNRGSNYDSEIYKAKGWWEM